MPELAAAQVTDDGLGTLAPTVALKDVQLCRVGVWNASTGQAPITQADLESMVRAAQDPGTDAAALFVGHYDQRTRHLADGEPALGWVTPTRVENGVLYGDLTSVPAKFAAVMPHAYRRRSIEVKFDRSPGARYPATLTGLAVLGVKTPAVKGLADVISRYSSGQVAADRVPSEAFELVDEAADTALSSSDTPTGHGPSDDGVPASPAMGSATPASRPGGQTVPSSADNLRALFGLAPDHDVTSLQSKLTAALSDGDDVPGTPIQTNKPEDLVKHQNDATATAPGLEGVGAGTARTQFTPEQLAAHRAATVTPAVAVSGGAGGKDLSPAELQAATEHTKLSELPEGVVVLSAGQLEQLRASAQRGEQAAAELDRQRRDGIITAALSEGRLTVDESRGWRDALDRDERGTYTLLSNLAEGRVPVAAQGHPADAPEQAQLSQEAEAAWDSWTRQLFRNELPPAPVGQ